MESSVDNITSKERKSSLTASPASPIAARTRSMQKRLSSSQNVQTSPVEKSPKKKLKFKRRTKSTDELSTSDIESCMKTLNSSNDAEDSVNPRSSKQSETSVIATRMSKSRNSKDSKIKVNAEATKVTRKSAQQESELLDIREKRTRKSLRSKTGEANAVVTQSPKAKSGKDLEDIEAQKMTRKSSQSDNELLDEETELTKRSSSVKPVEAKVTRKSPDPKSELSDAHDEVNSSESLLKKDSGGQKLAKEQSLIQELSAVTNGLKAKRKSKQLSDDHMLDILEKKATENLCDKEELDLKIDCAKFELVNESPKKESEIKVDKAMSESSSKKTKKKYAAQNSAENSPIKSVSANTNSEEESEKNTTDHIVEHSKERSPKKLFSSLKNKLINCDRRKVDSSADIVVTSPKKTNKKLNKVDYNVKTEKSKVCSSDVSSDNQFSQNVPEEKNKTVNPSVRSDLSPSSVITKKVQKDYSKLIENESISSEEDTSRSMAIQSLQSQEMLDNYSNKLGDASDISDSDIKSITQQKKTYKDSFSSIQEKVDKFVPNDDKVVIKPTKDEDKELNSKLPINTKAHTVKISAPCVISSKNKSFVVESFGSPINKTSPKSQPSKQGTITHFESDSDAESRKAIMESAQRRIEQNLSTSESDSRYLVKTAHKSSFRKPTVEAGSSDSGSAPENISFESGRKTAMESLKNAVESIQREKQRRKAKRKERLEKLKQQKEEKLIRLKEKLASQEDASCSSSEESGYEEVTSEAKRGKKKRVPKTRALRTEKENVEGSSMTVLKKTAFSDMDSDDSSTKVTGQVPVSGGLKRLPSDVLDNLPDQIPMKYPKISHEDGNKKKRKKEKSDLRDSLENDFKKPANLDYIPLETGGPTKFGVVPLEKAMKAPKAVSQQAADFRQNLLYGSHIKREPAKATTIYQQKMKASGNDIHVR
ncbi:serine-rich adhesin for platelets isoform X2 [Anabrus simplex]|uniref:serine-rich adhesin for platelets isoform X2 n=1 Tax=Anabrus simplex TaxID=316456 RepID=UPI0035A30ACA